MTDQRSLPRPGWVDGCLLLGDPGTTAPVAVPPGWLAVVVSPQFTGPVAAVVRRSLPRPASRADRPQGLVLLGGGDTAATELARATGVPVVAPDGEAFATPGGMLYAAGGWWRHAPGGRRAATGSRWPAPAWSALVPQHPSWPVTARPIPAGWLLTGPAPDPGAEPEAEPEAAAETARRAALDELSFSVAVDPDRPRLLLEPSVTGRALAAALGALPAAIRPAVDVVMLAPGQGAGRAVTAAAARKLGEAVHLVNGVPLYTPAGVVAVYALDAALRPVWPEPAGRLLCRPDGREEVVASTPPPLERDWVVHPSGGGLHAAPSSAQRADSPAEADGRYRVVVGAPGLDIDDVLWPHLSAMFAGVLTDIPAPVDLVVAGEATPWGLTAARELSERYAGADPGGEFAARPFRRVEPLPAGGAAVPGDGERAGLLTGRRRLVLVAAAVAALLLAGVGAAVAWPDGSRAVGGAAGSAARPPGGEPGLAPGAPGGSAVLGASPSASRASPSASRASASPGASTAPPAAAGAAGAPSPSASRTPANIDGGNDLAAGRSTRDSGHADGFVSAAVADGNPSTYWESNSNAFPQWVQVDLGAPAELRRAVLRLPTSGAWPGRTQRIEIRASTDDGTFVSLAGPASYDFTPAAGQRVTVTLPGGQWRYVRVIFTANSVGAAGQLSALELYST
jgi:hypothetical protein